MKYQSIRRQRDRAKQRTMLDRTQIGQPNALQPKLPFYAGASDHFGEVKSRYYAKRFLEVKDV